MTESSLIKLAIVILFLPLIGFTFTIFFGKKIKYTYILEIATVGIAFLLSAFLMFTKLSSYVYNDIYCYTYKLPCSYLFSCLYEGRYKIQQVLCLPWVVYFFNDRNCFYS